MLSTNAASPSSVSPLRIIGVSTTAGDTVFTRIASLAYVRAIPLDIETIPPFVAA